MKSRSKFTVGFKEISLVQPKILSGLHNPRPRSAIEKSKCAFDLGFQEPALCWILELKCWYDIPYVRDPKPSPLIPDCNHTDPSNQEHLHQIVAVASKRATKVQTP